MSPACLSFAPSLRQESLPHVKHWLVEKPVSAREYSSTSKAGQDVVCEAYDSLAVRGDAGAGAAVVGVGYHFTALQAVIKLKEILEQRKARIMATQARYNMAYEFARKLSWYDKSVSCGRELWARSQGFLRQKEATVSCQTRCPNSLVSFTERLKILILPFPRTRLRQLLVLIYGTFDSCPPAIPRPSNLRTMESPLLPSPPLPFLFFLPTSKQP